MSVAVFVALALSLVAATLLLLLRPWNKASASTGHAEQDVNADVYRDQLAEIDRDLTAGTLSIEDHAQARAEIQRRVLDDAANATVANDTPAASKKTAWILMAAFPLVAALLYLMLGAPQALDAKRATTRDDVEKMVAGLAARVEKNPNDTKGWIVLARSYRIMNRLPESQQAFERAGTALDNEPVLLAEYADVLATRAMGNFEGKPLELVNKAIALDPNNVVALSLAATAAYNRKDTAKAVAYWEQLQKLVPPESEDGQWLAQALEQVRGQGAGASAPKAGSAGSAKKSNSQAQVATAANATTAKASDAASGDKKSADKKAVELKSGEAKSGEAKAPPTEAITGRVSLATALKDKVQPTDTVFIFARPAQGSRMPLAVQRARVADLPLDFKLDDSMAMSPAAKISGATEVRIEARISKTGNATPAPGDLIGAGPVVKPGTGQVKVEIDQVRP